MRWKSAESETAHRPTAIIWTRRIGLAAIAAGLLAMGSTAVASAAVVNPNIPHECYVTAGGSGSTSNSYSYTAHITENPCGLGVRAYGYFNAGCNTPMSFVAGATVNGTGTSVASGGNWFWGDGNLCQGGYQVDYDGSWQLVPTANSQDHGYNSYVRTAWEFS
jgi:hypothetical protein